MSELYREWADELLQHLVEKFSDPYDPENYKKATQLLAEKLEADLKDSIVQEWFCGDCDYVRRYER